MRYEDRCQQRCCNPPSFFSLKEKVAIAVLSVSVLCGGLWAVHHFGGRPTPPTNLVAVPQ